MTMGIDTVMSATNVWLLVTGRHKAEILARMLEEPGRETRSGRKGRSTGIRIAVAAGVALAGAGLLFWIGSALLAGAGSEGSEVRVRRDPVVTTARRSRSVTRSPTCAGKTAPRSRT